MPLPRKISKIEYLALVEELGFVLVDEFGDYKVFHHSRDRTRRFVQQFAVWDIDIEDVLAQLEEVWVSKEEVENAYERLFSNS